jgi:Mn-dependent DtxR family transcriptional regulator
MPGRGASQRTLDAVLAVVPFAEQGQGLRNRDITARLTIVRSPITVRHALRELIDAGLVIGEHDKQHGFRRYRRAPP